MCVACSNKFKALIDITNPSFWEENIAKEHFRARILCLNKVYPQTPQIHEYRPIIIVSPIIKFLEGLLLPKLRNYAISKLHKWQFGFVPGVSIEECKAEVFEGINELKRNTPRNAPPSRRPHALFFDFKAAYDTVDRELLYNKLQEKNILNTNEIDLLKFIHKNLRVCLAGQQTTTSKGVPQGFSSSPILFDIYVESLL